MTCRRCAGFVVLEYEEDGVLHPRCVNCGGRDIPQLIKLRRAEILEDIRCIETLLSGRRCGGKRYINNPYCQRHQKTSEKEQLAS